MPLPLVSPTLFNAQALAADPADTHLQPGIHLRVSANPLLGLPVAPFIVWRGYNTSTEGFKLRNDVVYIGSKGERIAAPFSLKPDNPVTAYLVLRPGEVCVWARVVADPGGAPSRPRAPSGGPCRPVT